jgi:NAD-dependent SIR2 family protein deacetylase
MKMSKRAIKMSLKEMCITKHSLLKSISEKQDKLLKSNNPKETPALTNDIMEENRLYDKISLNIKEFKKENKIDDRVLSLGITDDLGDHNLQANSFTVRCKKCGSERPLLKTDIDKDNIRPNKCKCGGENEFKYWLETVYSEEEYEELERKSGQRYKFEGYHKGEGEPNE